MTINIDSLPDEAKKALEMFPEFQISEFNESGANGYVMIGRHNVLMKDVAIKIYFHDESEIDQEPTIIVSINHENVLKVYDARKVEKSCSFYMMQAANGGDLFCFLNRQNISLSSAHRLLCQLLSGLSSLHSETNKLVHRDLKPENLLIHDDSIIIADFGSVRRINESTGKAPASRHSILYRPPEAFGNNAFFDYSSDIYQAGIIGYLLFGGKLDNDLLTHLTEKELLKFKALEKNSNDYDVSVFIDDCIGKRIKAGKLLNWDSMPFYIPKKIKSLLKKSAAKHDNRYRNASEFLAELAKIKAIIPDWITESDGYLLKNWNGRDYFLKEEKSMLS
jgi:serine/threonine protein kinase